MVFKDYYKILNLDTNKVTSQEIKNAFREQAKKYHPDINNQSHQYEERFKDIMKHIECYLKVAVKESMIECGTRR